MSGWSATRGMNSGCEPQEKSCRAFIPESHEACEVNDTPAWNHRLHRPGLPSPGYILADE